MGVLIGIYDSLPTSGHFGYGIVTTEIMELRLQAALPLALLLGFISPALAASSPSSVPGPLRRGEETVVVVEHADAEATAAFKFARVQSPRRNDVAAKAIFTLIDGRRDPNGGNLGVLNDGLFPAEEDQPSANFFFQAGTQGGRIAADLGALTTVSGLSSYSWHPGGRGPQVYSVYGATGTNPGFLAAPARPIDLIASGWELIARVDTRTTAKESGGQYAVAITNNSSTLGSFRYLLWDIESTDKADPFGNTFYSEIDVIVPNPEPEPAPDAVQPDLASHRKTIQLDGGYEILLDTSETPDLTEWAEGHLTPMIEEWYPKIIAMLPSEGYAAPKRVSIHIRKDMQGVAATSGTRINCAANWMRRELKGEAVGSVFHELVHVVQQYGRARRTNPAATSTPGWIVEGIPDYLRWYIFEPQSRGAEISPRNAARARYDGSYRISANFLNWVVTNHDKNLIRKLNDAARQGNYREDLWKDWTGQTVQQLGEQWKASLPKAG